MIRRLWLAGAVALAGCDPEASLVQPHFGVSRLVQARGAGATPGPQPSRAGAPGYTVVPAASLAPAASPAAVATSVIPAAPAGGGSTGGTGGGGSSGPTPIAVSGSVVDELGQPVAGATIAGGSGSASTDASGHFSATVAVAGTPLVAGAFGYTSHAATPPYAFVLTRRAPQPGAAFTLDGTVTPAAANVNVRYADQEGTSASAFTAADGSFHLTIQPAGPRLPGLVVASSSTPLPGAPRLLALDPPQVGAAHVDAAATGVAVALVPLDRTCTVNAQPPAGLQPDSGIQRVVDDAGVAIALAGTDGSWPTSFPVAALPGAHLSLLLIAADAGHTGISVAERLDPAAGEAWAPTLLPLPVQTGTLAVPGTVQWANPGASGALDITGAYDETPSFELTTSGGSASIPAALRLTPGPYVLNLWASDQPGLGYPSLLAAPATRRYARSQVAFTVP